MESVTEKKADRIRCGCGGEGVNNRYIDGMNSLKDILYKPRVMAAMNFVLHRNA